MSENTVDAGQLRHDLTAGVATSLTTIPKAMAYGSVAFVPLGIDYVPMGIMAGLIALAFGNLVSFRNSSPILINSTFSLASMMLASVLVLLMDKVSFLPEPNQAPVAITLLLFVVFCSGLLQVIAGLIKLGGFARYIPRPVIAGLTNGVSVLIILGQLPILIAGSSELGVLGSLAEFNLINLTVGISAIAIFFYSKRLVPAIPPVFVVLILGSLIFYAVSAFQGDKISPVLGHIPLGLPLPVYGMQFLSMDLELLKQCAFLLPYLFAVAGILSLWSLLFMSTADNMQGRRSSGNDELISQGMSNMLIPLFGGICVAGNSNTLVNYSNGGRGKLSKVSCGAFAIAVVMFLGPVIGMLPLVILSGVLIIFSIQAIDKWSIAHARLLLGQTREGLPDFLIMLCVMIILLALGVLEAVVAGIVISLLLFIQRMGKEVVRADTDGTQIRASVMRGKLERGVLQGNGHRIRVIEIEGALFFGTADNVFDYVQSLENQQVRYVILDMRRITDVDGTGADVLIRIRNHCLRCGQELLLSGIDTRESDNAFLQSIGTLDIFTDKNHFVYMNDALAAAEDRILQEALGDSRYDDQLSFQEIDIIAGFCGLYILLNFRRPQ
jgi:SulP family sulfate permease